MEHIKGGLLKNTFFLNKHTSTYVNSTYTAASNVEDRGILRHFICKSKKEREREKERLEE